MAEFDTLRPEGAWLTGTPVTQAEFAAFDAMRPSMLNGTEGSFHEPIAPIILGGEGLRVTKTPSHDDDVTNKEYVDDLFTTGGVVTSMRAFSQLRDSLNWPADNRFAHYGWGKNVGVVGILSGTSICAGRVNSAGTSSAAVTLFTPTVAPAGNASFAQNADGSVIVGTSVEANQRAWYSTDGGITWNEVALPGTVGSANEVVVAFNRFNGNFFIFRAAVADAGLMRTYRSTDNGASWTQMGATLSNGGASRATSIAFDSASRIFANTNLNTLSSTFRSTDNGANWSNAYASSPRYINSVVEWNGSIYGLGHNSSTGLPYVGAWSGSAWNDVSASFAPGPIAFTRFATTMPGLIVALAISAFGASGTPYWMASRDGGQTWRVLPMNGTGFHDRYQSPSPGGIHVMTTNSASTMTLATLEV